MSYDIEYLYGLLPAYIREKDSREWEYLLSKEQIAEIRLLETQYNNLSDKTSADALKLQERIEEGKKGSLKSILTLFAQQVAILEENLEQLYDDQFIETCAEWVVPYIADLIGVKGLPEVPGLSYSQRAQVANTIAYRRRKGTAAVVEQLARDVTGWTANVVEYFQRLATTQYMNYTRPNNISTVNLRQGNNIEQLNTPFDTTNRTIEVRNIRNRSGKYNISNLGVFLWLHLSLPLTNSPAKKVDKRKYTFDVTGYDTNLYNRAIPEKEIAHLAKMENVPHRLTKRLLRSGFKKYYGDGKSFTIYVNGKKVMPGQNQKLSDLFTVCSLNDLRDNNGIVTGWNNMPKNKITIDPELGRIAFPSSKPPPQKVKVSYHYRSLASMGGGTYNRSGTFNSESGNVQKVPGTHNTIQDAINALGHKGGTVEVANNDVFKESLKIVIPAGKVVELRAANRCRPVIDLQGDIKIHGGKNSEFHINGFLVINGTLLVPPKNNGNIRNKLSKISITHSAIRNISGPVSQSAISVECPETKVFIDNSITGAIRTTEHSEIELSGSITDAGLSEYIAISGLDTADPAGPLTIKKSTIIGKIHSTIMELISDSILLAKCSSPDSWNAPVIADRTQAGCVRYSYYPWGSILPGPYKCISPGTNDDHISQPVLESKKYGAARYCELSLVNLPQITEGSETHSEMGAFHDTYKAQKIKNLQTRMDEYLPFGIEAGIFPV